MKKIYLFLPYFLIACTSFTSLAYATCPTTIGRFVPEGSNLSEVRDTKTQLVWARCSVGQQLSGNACINTATAMSHEAALVYAATQPGWRLPNVKELGSLADKGCINPAIDIAAFPNTVANYYWTSSPYLGDTRNVMVIYFYDSYVNSNVRLNNSYVRLVR
jgi:Protein of unknown function (DUF1566)